jgi:hypothetical protein
MITASACADVKYIAPCLSTILRKRVLNASKVSRIPNPSTQREVVGRCRAERRSPEVRTDDSHNVSATYDCMTENSHERRVRLDLEGDCETSKHSRSETSNEHDSRSNS